MGGPDVLRTSCRLPRASAKGERPKYGAPVYCSGPTPRCVRGEHLQVTPPDLIFLRGVKERTMSAFSASSHRPRPLVVVAEDDVEARTMLGVTLELGGFDVVLAVDGCDAVMLSSAAVPMPLCRT